MRLIIIIVGNNRQSNCKGLYLKMQLKKMIIRGFAVAPGYTANGNFIAIVYLLAGLIKMFPALLLL